MTPVPQAQPQLRPVSAGNSGKWGRGIHRRPRHHHPRPGGMAAGVFAFADPKEPLEEVRIGHDFEPEPGGPTRRSTAHGLGPRGRATTGSSDVVDTRSCEYGSMNALEEGTVAQIDFEKVRSAARSTHALIPVVLQDGTPTKCCSSATPTTSPSTRHSARNGLSCGRPPETSSGPRGRRQETCST